MPGILTYFPDLNIDNCPRIWNVDLSLTPSSTTIILDTRTGQLVPHWVELDHSSDDEQPLG